MCSCLDVFNKLLGIIVIIILGCLPNVFAQSNWDEEPTEYAVEGVLNVSASIISDSFVPMTHYDPGEWRITGVPAWFQVDRAFEDPDITGKDLYGWAGALGGGYAFTDRIMIYCISAYMSMDGDVKGKLYGDAYPSVTVDTEFKLFSFHLGGGFDLVKGGGRWSFPVFAGLFIQHYDARIALPQVSYTYGLGTETLQVTAEDQGVLYGFNTGIVASCDLFKKFRISPYILFNQSFNHPEITAEVEDSLLPASEDETVKLDPVTAAMFGLSLTFISTKRLSFSLSAGGILSSSTRFYNKTFLDGLRMKSIVLAVTYNDKPKVL